MLALAGSVAAQDGSVSIPLSSGDVVLSVWQIIGGLVAAFVTGGTVGVAGLAMFVGKLRQDHLLKDSLEKLAVSLPSDTLYQVRQLIMLGREAFTLADEVTDGKPNAKPAGPTLSEVAAQAYSSASSGQIDWLKAPDDGKG